MIPMRIMKEISKEWQEIMEIAEKIPYGQIIIKIDNKKVNLVEYRILKRPGDPNDFEVRPL